MLSVKQGSIKYHFLNLWYDSTWDWTQVSQAIGKHSNHYAKALKKKKKKKIFLSVYFSDVATFWGECYLQFNFWF